MSTGNVKQKEGDIFTVIRELEAKRESAPAGKKAIEKETVPDPLKLRESLLVKRDLFRRLERVGYTVEDADIQIKLSKAIHELDEIIRATS